VIEFLKTKNDRDFTALHARRAVEMATDLYIALQFLRYARFSEHKQLIAEKFIADMSVSSAARYQTIMEDAGLVTQKWQEMLVD
jgi:hypothetical protein